MEKMKFLWTFSFFLALITVSISIPTSPTHQRLGSDEIRITTSNRDVCLAKLLCGMSVVTLEDAYNSGTKDGEIYGDYAQIVAKFFQENPLEEFDDDDGSLSAESVEAALEDYSVSNEDEDEYEEASSIQQYLRPKRPESQKKKAVQRVKKRPAAPTTAAAPVQIIKRTTTTTTTTPKPTPPGIQIFGLGMPVQEITTKPKAPKSLFDSPQISDRLSKTKKVVRRAGLATKLRTVRQCQRISGCTYTFKQLYQKYGGKGVIDELSQPIQPLHVVDEQWSRRPKPQPQARPQETATKGPLENPWISPSDTSSPAQPSPTAIMDFDVEYGGLGAKIPAALEAYFQASLNSAGEPSLMNPGTTYKIKKGQKQQPAPLFQSIAKKHKRKRITTTTEPSTTTTTTTTTTAPTTTTATTTTTTTTPAPTTTTTPPRRLVHYKRPPSKKKPTGDDDDEDDNINVTAPFHLIGNPEHDFDDEAVDKKQHEVEYEDDDDEDDDEEGRQNESHDDYDEEAKYNVPVDYGNDNDDESDEQDDEDDRPVRKSTSKRKPELHVVKLDKLKQEARQPEEAQTQTDVTKSGTDVEGQRISPPKQKYRPRPPARTKFTSEFASVQNGNLKRLKKKGKGKQKESKENTSEEADDEDFQDDQPQREEPPPFEFPTHIGGRPIFPDYGIPVTAYGMTRSTMPAGEPQRPPMSPLDPRPPPPKTKTSTKERASVNSFPVNYNYPPQGSLSHNQQSGGHDPGLGYEPTSGISVLSPIKSLFKHLSSGISPNPVGGGMGYTPNQSPSSLHYKMPPQQSVPPMLGGGSGGPPSGGSYPPGITIPLKLKEPENPNVPQIAIMPQVPKGPESSEYKRPTKYTVNKTKKIPSL